VGKTGQCGKRSGMTCKYLKYILVNGRVEEFLNLVVENLGLVDNIV
jgi:hypothetical protein